MRTSCHSEDAGTFPQVPVRTRVPPAHEPLCANLAHEFQEPRTNCTLDPTPTRIQLYFRTSWRPETQKCRCSLKTALPRGMYALSQSRVTSGHKTSTSYFSPTRSRLGSAGSENGTAKRHRHRAHSAGSRNRTTTRVPHTKATGPSGNCSLWETAYYSATGNPPTDDPK
jgi:hypothetical protein